MFKLAAKKLKGFKSDEILSSLTSSEDCRKQQQKYGDITRGQTAISSDKNVLPASLLDVYQASLSERINEKAGEALGKEQQEQLVPLVNFRNLFKKKNHAVTTEISDKKQRKKAESDTQKIMKEAMKVAKKKRKYHKDDCRIGEIDLNKNKSQNDVSLSPKQLSCAKCASLKDEHSGSSCSILRAWDSNHTSQSALEINDKNTLSGDATRKDNSEDNKRLEDFDFGFGARNQKKIRQRTTRRRSTTDPLKEIVPDQSKKVASRRREADQHRSTTDLENNGSRQLGDDEGIEEVMCTCSGISGEEADAGTCSFCTQSQPVHYIRGRVRRSKSCEVPRRTRSQTSEDCDDLSEASKAGSKPCHRRPSILRTKQNLPPKTKSCSSSTKALPAIKRKSPRGLEMPRRTPSRSKSGDAPKSAPGRTSSSTSRQRTIPKRVSSRSSKMPTIKTSQTADERLQFPSRLYSLYQPPKKQESNNAPKRKDKATNQRLPPSRSKSASSMMAVAVISEPNNRQAGWESKPTRSKSFDASLFFQSSANHSERRRDSAMTDFGHIISGLQNRASSELIAAMRVEPSKASYESGATRPVVGRTLSGLLKLGASYSREEAFFKESTPLLKPLESVKALSKLPSKSTSTNTESPQNESSLAHETHGADEALLELIDMSALKRVDLFAIQKKLQKPVNQTQVLRSEDDEATLPAPVTGPEKQGKSDLAEEDSRIKNHDLSSDTALESKKSNTEETSEDLSEVLSRLTDLLPLKSSQRVEAHESRTREAESQLNNRSDEASTTQEKRSLPEHVVKVLEAVKATNPRLERWYSTGKQLIRTSSSSSMSKMRRRQTTTGLLGTHSKVFNFMAAAGKEKTSLTSSESTSSLPDMHLTLNCSFESLSADLSNRSVNSTLGFRTSLGEANSTRCRDVKQRARRRRSSSLSSSQTSTYKKGSTNRFRRKTKLPETGLLGPYSPETEIEMDNDGESLLSMPSSSNHDHEAFISHASGTRTLVLDADVTAVGKKHSANDRI